MKNNFTIMKKMYILMFSFLLSVGSITAQVTDVLTGLSGPSGLAIEGNELFFCELIGGKISKLNINNPSVVTEIVSGISPFSMVKDGNIIYFVEYSNSRVMKVDLSAATPIAELLVSYSNPVGIAIKGTDLYVSSFNNTIAKVDLTATTPVAEVILSDLGYPFSLFIKGDKLFFSQGSGDKVSVVDLMATTLSPTDIVTIDAPEPIVVNGDFLYIGQATTDKIFKYDMNDPNATLEEVASGFSNPRVFGFDGLDLYISDYNIGKIVKFKIGAPSFATFSPVCDGSTANSLGGASPTGGVYSGTNIMDNGDGETFSLDVATAGVGFHTVNYTLSGEMVTSTIEVIAAPDVTLTLDDTYFVVDGVLPTGIGGGSPAGGVYSDPYAEITDDGNGMTFSFNSTVMTGFDNTITYTFTDPDTGCSGSASMAIQVLASTDVDDLEKVNLEIFPNPTTGIINFEGTPTDRIEVIDVNGKTLKVETTPTNTLDISALPKGIYFLRINVEDQVVTQRIIKE